MHRLELLFKQDVDPADVACFVLEPVQGEGGFIPMPPEFVRALKEVCGRHGILYVDDEVQSGCGRTGTMWAIERFDVEPDLIVSGKTLGGGLPLAAVTGRAELMDAVHPGGLGGTFGGNPVCCAAALASIDIVVNEKLAANACSTGDVLHQRLREIQKQVPEIGCIQGKGLVAGLACVRTGTTAPDANLGWEVVRHCFENGVLMFTPVGFGGATVKIAPALVITEAAILESTAVLEEAFEAQCK